MTQGVATGSVASSTAFRILTTGLFAGAGTVKLIILGGGIFLGVCGACYLG